MGQMRSPALADVSSPRRDKAVEAAAPVSTTFQPAVARQAGHRGAHYAAIRAERARPTVMQFYPIGLAGHPRSLVVSIEYHDYVILSRRT